MSEKQQSKFTGDLDKIQGRDYLRAHSAITWFRTDYPADKAGIRTELLSVQPIVFKAEVWIDGVLAATAHASENAKNKDYGKLETNAVRRALAYCGYGTEAAVGDDDYDPETGNSLPNNIQQAARNAGGTVSKRENADAQDDLTNRDTAADFMKATRAAGIEDTDVLKALGVSKLSEWTQGRKAAGQRVKEWQALQSIPQPA